MLDLDVDVEEIQHPYPVFPIPSAEWITIKKVNGRVERAVTGQRYWNGGWGWREPGCGGVNFV